MTDELPGCAVDDPWQTAREIPPRVDEAEPEREAEAFTIKDDSSLDWALRRRALLLAEAATVRQQAKRMTEHARALAAEAERFDAYVLPMIEAHWRTKGLKTEHRDYGTLRVRQTRPAPAVTDTEAAVEHCVANGLTELLKVELRTRAFLEYAEAQGATLPGIGVRPGGETFSVSGPVIEDGAAPPERAVPERMSREEQAVEAGRRG